MSYKENIGVSLLDQWKPPSNSAIQLSAVIIASARIHIYPYISRDDCYYTDTDSVVLAPKQYYYKDKKEDKETLKHKGVAKNYVKKETFEDIYKEPFQKIPVEVENVFESDKK
nr:hypothetical protein [Tanacetum cinerariifolium]